MGGQAEDLETVALEWFCGARIPSAKDAPTGQLLTICTSGYQTTPKQETTDLASPVSFISVQAVREEILQGWWKAFWNVMMLFFDQRGLAQAQGNGPQPPDICLLPSATWSCRQPPLNRLSSWVSLKKCLSQTPIKASICHSGSVTSMYKAT